MKLFILIVLFGGISNATPVPISAQNIADRSENLEPSPHTSTWISPTDHDPKKRHLQPYLKFVAAGHPSEIPLSEADNYERLVAFCEAGFVSGCRAAIGKPK
ncbi:hypothetical protein N7533_004994 [Penicillium manginii]|jgi:hypothetical protein|uniref:uncharacterized protein n=1 Tax=Penicillium manginii TaxID=203109 RepID=UPI002548B406|nr:uncharacterized protein N7533_004994 [Penicillium manginii]KAJ5755451.1 hypothetical protein N7533_004994 [Penicillium manginii]